MAVIFRLDDLNSAPASERMVLESLSTLSDEWYVFHSVRWQSVRHGRQGDGEADFVLVNRRRGIIVLEVKGGAIDIDAGRWYSTDSAGVRHQIRDPFQQATASKHALVNFLRELNPPLSHIRVGHGVVFPSVERAAGLPLNAQPEITLFANDLLECPRSIERCATHWNLSQPFSETERNRIVSLLAPTVLIKPSLRSLLDRAEAELVRLTEGQQKLFARLHRVRRLVVLGCPGSGKTLLAIARARSLADQGFRTRLVCYNELLGQQLREAVRDQPQIEAGSFHAQCMRRLRTSGHDIPQNPDVQWWAAEAPRLFQIAVTQGPEFDALVIDEAQDFSPDWTRALMADLRDQPSAPLYAFADMRQELHRRDWRAGLPIENEYELIENCRSTRPIARSVASIFEDAPPPGGPDGPRPSVVELERGDDKVGIVCDLVERMIREEGIRAEEVVLLCDDPATLHRLRNLSIADCPVVPFGHGGVVAETIGRFKGLESTAVVVVLSDTTDAPRDRLSNAYVGLSRARSLAVVVLAALGHPSRHSLLRP